MNNYYGINNTSAELYHYGVKGMKWGVRRYRNEDGSLTPAGKKRIAKDIRKNTDFTSPSTWYNGQPRVANPQKRIANMPEIQELHNKLSSSRKDLHDKLKFATDFNSDDDLVEAYQEKAALKFCKDAKITDRDTIDYVIFGYKYDDLDQGSDGSFALYCRDKKVDYEKYVADVRKAENQYEETCRKYVDEMLNEYGSKRVGTGYFGKEETISTVATRALKSIDDNERMREKMYLLA